MGLVANAFWRIEWAAPIAALFLLPLILREGWAASKGNPCESGPHHWTKDNPRICAPGPRQTLAPVANH
jgi:hypothetical protein